MKQFREIAKDIEESKKDMEILSTGFYSFDDKLEGGFLKKELVVIGGATGKGKSLVAGNLFFNIAKAGYKSAYFSLEISNNMVASRLIGAHSNLSPTRVMIKTLDENDTKKSKEAQADISVYEEFMYFYDDLYEYDKIEKQIRENDFDFVVIDFIQNIISKQGDEYERLSTIALNLQKLAKETNTCILVLSQLSNQVVRDKKSSLVEYKGSGTIGTVCDLGFFIEDGLGENVLSIRLRKNRRGVSGAVFDFIVKTPGGGLEILQ